MARLVCPAHALLFALTLLWTPATSAQEPVEDAVALDARAAQLEAALRDVKRPTRMYFGGWLAALSTMAVTQFGLSFAFDNEGQRASMWLGAGLSTAGVGLLLITPFPGRYGADELAGMPSATVGDKRAKVARGEQLLEREANSAWFQRAWFQHLFTTALGAGVITFLGVLYPDELWTAAVPSGIGTFLTAEAQIWTRPRRAVDHWERYQRGPEVTVAPLLMPNSAGFGLRGRF